MLMQMRNNCNHPDLITSKFDNSPTFPPADVLLEQSGKLQLLDRLLVALKARGHKVLIFSQVSIPLSSVAQGYLCGDLRGC
jgi:ATP-dependent DNA helicase